MNKTLQLENQLLNEIRSNKYPPGKLIPSRNSLAKKFDCSRTTVERAIANLTRNGYLEARKGSGTFVRSSSGLSVPIQTVWLVEVGNLVDSWTSSSRILNRPLDIKMEVMRIQYEDIAAKFDRLARPGNAVIWVVPDVSHIFTMNLLRERGVPQLLINRHYEGFDCVYTDSKASLREGLAWLMGESGNQLALVTLPVGEHTPYYVDRLLAFYPLCFELGAKIRSEHLIELKGNPLETASEAANMLFGTPHAPKGIFLTDYRFALPLVVIARSMKIEPSRDFKILAFDFNPDLEHVQGIGMMIQNYTRFGMEAVRWLERLNSGEQKYPFRIPVKTVFYAAGQKEN